jgi:hypothetical protein
VPAAVLILFWGAVAWIRSATGKSAKTLMTCIAMLAYGWVFHNGMFNFYLSTGLAFWALALAWNPKRARLCGAVALLALANTAHALPVVWGVAVLAYVWMARCLPGRWAAWLPAAAIAAVVACRVIIELRYKVLSTFHQILEMSGIDQVWVFGPKYIAPAVALGMLWGFLLLRLLYSRPLKEFLGNALFQLCAVMSVAVLIAPTRVELGDYRMALAFITERMTLPFGVLICVMLSQAEPLAWQKRAFLTVALVQFSFLYVDTGALNRWEDRMAEAVAPLPAGARVVSSLNDFTSRTPVWSHPVERACIGRCYSYQNYEPGSLQFRLQARRPNGIVMYDAVDAGMARRGDYVAREADLPLYQVTPCADGKLCTAAMSAGERMTPATLSMLPALW